MKSELRFLTLDGGPEAAPSPTAAPGEDAGGWIRLHRRALESGVLRSGGLRLFGLFCCLLLEAAWKPRRVNSGTLQAGQLSITVRSYAKAHGLSVKELRGSLKKLQGTGSISAQQRAHRYTLITLTNWALYNGEPGEEGTAKGTGEGTPRAHRGHTEPSRCPEIGALKGPKKVRSKEEVKDPRVKTLGDALSNLFHEKTGHVLKEQARLRKDLKALLGEGKVESAILEAYRAFLEEPEPFFRDRAWGKFEGWWIAHPNASGGPARTGAARLEADLRMIAEAKARAGGLSESRRGPLLEGVLRRLAEYPEGLPPQIEAGISDLREALRLGEPR
jgi:hypothetical protein